MPSQIPGTSLYQIANTDCVGDSLPYINANTVTLNNSITTLTTNVNTITTLINSVSALFASAPSVAKAWVNFSGRSTAGTVTVNAGYNVSTVTRNGAGLYTINFANNLNNANYAVLGNVTGPNTNSLTVQAGAYNTAPTLKTTSQVEIATTNGNTNYDFYNVYVAIFGN